MKGLVEWCSLVSPVLAGEQLRHSEHREAELMEAGQRLNY